WNFVILVILIFELLVCISFIVASFFRELILVDELLEFFCSSLFPEHAVRSYNDKNTDETFFI
ncbi:hypothetical protein, partial [Enterococcus faecalis]|uniref:hypothetical protein n=1 Tax=Enterococcus faecalis TaxID=1351 RepID=UPI003D6A12C1